MRIIRAACSVLLHIQRLVNRQTLLKPEIGLVKKRSNLYDVVVSSRFMRLVIFRVFEQHFVHVGGGVLEKLVGAAEDDEGDLAIAQHRQLVGFLHQTEFALGERHLNR